MAIPAYYESSSLWAQSISQSPRVGGYVILNPIDGPGNAVVSSYVTLIKNVQAAGVKVIGYVATGYGAVSASTAKTYVDRYKAWYGVDGIFFDEVSADSAQVSYYQGLANYVKATAGTFVSLNPGTIPDEAYMNVADTVCIYEDAYDNFVSWKNPSWINKYPASKITYLIYDAPDSASVTNAITLTKQRNGGYLYVTNDNLPNPWDTLPPYWSQELSLMGVQ